MQNQRIQAEREFREFFGRRLRSARIAANLSQKGLAYRLQIGQDTISNYERGKAVPNIVIVFQIAQAIGIHVSHFFPNQPFTLFPYEDHET